jgi:hypothetical protein
MAKVKGATLEFWYDGKEIPIISVNQNADFETSDGTDTATPDSGKDVEAGILNSTFSVEANLYLPLGTEVVTGTLVERKRYIVTAGAITEGANVYEVGRIFESNGTGLASATNKVKPLGKKTKGKNMTLSLAGSNFPVSDFDFDLKYDELDASDTSSGGGAETEVSRAERESKIVAIMKDNVAEKLVYNSDPVEQSAVFQFADDCRVAGALLILGQNIESKVDDIVKANYTCKWLGAPIETNFGLPAGEIKPFKIIYKRGATTNKEISGNCIITSKTIKGQYKGTGTISYNFKINGVPTVNVAN